MAAALNEKSLRICIHIEFFIYCDSQKPSCKTWLVIDTYIFIHFHTFFGSCNSTTVLSGRCSPNSVPLTVFLSSVSPLTIKDSRNCWPYNSDVRYLKRGPTLNIPEVC
jgi:hypothetical protein